MLNPVLSQLKSNIQSRRTYLCVGLDPDPAKLPSGFSQTIEGVEVYLKEIIRLSSERCIAYKPNISFFEGLGIDGLAMLQRLRNYVPAGTPWIIDGKRGDIGNTSAMQARFLFDHLGADASTLHPYMGNDSLAPFFEYRDKLHFVLALTSNPGSATFEKRVMADGRPLWATVVSQCTAWNVEYGNIGLVVGGTNAELSQIRTQSPRLPFLVPGVGAQGGIYEDVVKDGVSSDGILLVNASRQILYGDGNWEERVDRELDRFLIR